jgi:hypothetical protein
MLLLSSSHGVLVRQGVQANCFQWNIALVDGNYIVTTMSRGEGDGKVSLTPCLESRLTSSRDRIYQARPIHQDSHKERAAAFPVPRERERANEPFSKLAIAVQFACGGKATDKKGNRYLSS